MLSSGPLVCRRLSSECASVFSRDELFRQSLSRLREQVVRANALVREANFLSEEMLKLTDYQVTLQIPAANLSANRKVRVHTFTFLRSADAFIQTSGQDQTIQTPRKVFLPIYLLTHLLMHVFINLFI